MQFARLQDLSRKYLEVSEKVFIFADRNKTCKIMTQLVITLKDQSYLPNIRRIVKSLVGVEKDAKEGRINSYESSEDFFKKMGISPC